MIQSDKYDGVFIFVPRTASTSFEEALMRGDPDAINIHPDFPPFRHQTAAEIGKTDITKYAVLRNPTEWLISFYQSHKGQGSVFQKNMAQLNNKSGMLTKNDILELWCFISKWYISPGNYRQVDWIGDSEIILFENLPTFCEERGIPDLGYENYSVGGLGLTLDALRLAMNIWEKDYTLYRNVLIRNALKGGLHGF